MMEHAGLVHSIARRIQPSSNNFTCSRDDLISEGFLGLALAYKDFDPSKCGVSLLPMLIYAFIGRCFELDECLIANYKPVSQVVHNYEEFEYYISILSEKTQVIMRMYYIEGLKLYEIASRLICSKQWVSRRRHQGLKAIRTYLQLTGETYEELEDHSMWSSGTSDSGCTGITRCA